MNFVAWSSLALLGLRASRAKLGLGRLLDELKAVLELRGWYFESAEGSQSRYGFADDHEGSEAFADRVQSIQKEHRDLVSGQA